MEQEIRRLISEEDPRNPYTDDQLAGALALRRDKITALRKAYGIPDSRERRKPVLLRDIARLMAEYPNASHSELTGLLKKEGYQLSRFTVTQMRQQLDESTQNVPTEHVANSMPIEQEGRAGTRGESPAEAASHAFDDIIGVKGSLKQQIKQVKAAVLYPPYGLHLLIIGPTGAGKSNLAHAVYRYAVEAGKLREGSPFVVFNCADYADNPQLLLSQLFGHAKGSFTGAASGKTGLVEKADKGILFLDEVHRLPPEGQELLYYLMDHGKFRRLGETENTRAASVMIIAATTENVESSLLLTFRRRIPMVVSLPALGERPLSERYLIIKQFLYKESARIDTRIRITHEALRALMLQEYPGNIGQLRSDIQVACAKGYLAYLNGESPHVLVEPSELPFFARSRTQNVWSSHPEIDSLVRNGLLIDHRHSDVAVSSARAVNALGLDIYQYTEERFQELQRKGIASGEINSILGEELELKFEQIIRHYETNSVQPHDIRGIVEPKVAQAIEAVKPLLEAKVGRVENSFYYCIAVHLNATLKRLRENKRIYNPKLDQIRENYPFEFRLAGDIIKAIEPLLEVVLPEDEVGYLAMYLRTITQPATAQEKHIGVIVISHGRVASALVEVAHAFLEIDHAVALEMALDEAPEQMLERVVETTRSVDSGQGVLLLVDMGSLASFGEEVTQRTGIPVKVVDRVDIIMLMEAIRRAMLPGASLEEIAATLRRQDSEPMRRRVPTAKPKENVILSVCVTGEGSALVIKNALETAASGFAEKVSVIPLGILGDEDIARQIAGIQKEKRVIAMAGTIDPGYPGIPFFSMESILAGNGMNRLKKLLPARGESLPSETPPPAAPDFSGLILPELVFVHPACRDKVTLLEKMFDALADAGRVAPEYLFDIYKRELMGSPVYSNKIAIPHGGVENVHKTSIAVALLRHPLEWTQGQTVSIVFLLALQEGSGPVLRWLHAMMNDGAFLDQLNAQTETDKAYALLRDRLSLLIGLA